MAGKVTADHTVADLLPVRHRDCQLQKLAVAWYVDGHLQRVIARKLRVSERHLRRMHESLLVGAPALEMMSGHM
ncbi:hypothetical protein [Cupriavidus gilardii]|uniref:hypothetical protein n=1 Tax=Cupriavidus gilardii TaxID=82541 RepID=UPI0021BF2A0B|nr:hypothetical protein [Cupriavidus gilardii]